MLQLFGSLLVYFVPGSIVLNVLYNARPFRLSGQGPFEMPIVVTGYAMVSVYGFLVSAALGQVISGSNSDTILRNCPNVGYWFHVVFLVLRTQFLTELLDFDEDRDAKRRTSAVMFGVVVSSHHQSPAARGDVNLPLVLPRQGA